MSKPNNNKKQTTVNAQKAGTKKPVPTVHIADKIKVLPNNRVWPD